MHKEERRHVWVPIVPSSLRPLCNLRVSVVISSTTLHVGVSRSYTSRSRDLSRIRPITSNPSDTTRASGQRPHPGFHKLRCNWEQVSDISKGRTTPGCKLPP